jgi:hypothetical protein
MIWRWVRYAVLVGLFFGLATYGLDEVEGSDKLLAAILVLIGAGTVTFATSKVWPEPKQKT